MASRRLATGAVTGVGARPANVGSDRRLVRGGLTRRKIVEAMIDLIEEGNPHPTNGQVAERARVSVGLLRYHFSHVSLIVDNAAAVQISRHCLSVVAIPPRGPLPVRIRATCHQRHRVLEAVTPVLQVAYSRSPVSSGLRHVLDEQRAVLRRHVATTFSPELASRGSDADMLLELLDLATGWQNWNTLRVHGRRSASYAEGVMVASITALLG